MSTSRLGQHRHGPGGAHYRIVATGDSTNNQFFTLECVEPPGGGTPLHCHTREDEWFYVIDGELTFFADGKTLKLGPGQSLYAPRNIPHCFKNCSAGTVKFLALSTPPDIEGFFDYGLPASSGGPPADQEMFERIMKLAPQFGLQVLGPSPL